MHEATDPRARVDAEALGPLCLVTGGAGYLGAALVRALLDVGVRVRVFDVRPADFDDPRVEVVVGDVRSYRALSDACEGVVTVFHAAAIINLLGLYGSDVRRRVFDINVLGTEHVLRACRAKGVARLVYTSSVNVGIDRVVDEGDERDGYARSFVDLYTESKVTADRLVLDADDVDGLRTCALRPGGIWGPGEGGLMIKAFLTELAAGRFKASIGDGRAVADNTHVDNLVDAELLAALGLAERADVVGGQGYYVTDDERINGVEWFRPLAEGLGYDFPRLRVPGRLMYRIAHGLELAHLLGAAEPTVTRIGVLKLTRSSAFRIDKARRELGYEPRVRRDDGLAALLPDARATHDRLRGQLR